MSCPVGLEDNYVSGRKPASTTCDVTRRDKLFPLVAMSSQHVLPANAQTFAYCGRTACPNKNTQFAVHEMKIIRFGDANDRRFVCSTCYAHYMERVASQQTETRGKFLCATALCKVLTDVQEYQPRVPCFCHHLQ
jgi:hypothetical protein